MSCNNVRIDWGSKSPIKATTSPLFILDTSTAFSSAISLNRNSPLEWTRNG
ncbi:hypothetical protein N9I17_03200 [Amylibacter sp.]|nr:hypothetical protein [Amylibacter sp.]